MHSHSLLVGSQSYGRCTRVMKLRSNPLTYTHACISYRTPFFRGVIPGGQSLLVPQGPITTVAEQGTGYSWSPSIRTGTTVVIIAGDNRGLGSGCSSTYFINPSDDTSCLNSTSPSSTAGSPAGGSYPTSTSGAGTGDSSGGHHTDTGAIVGKASHAPLYLDSETDLDVQVVLSEVWLA